MLKCVQSSRSHGTPVASRRKIVEAASNELSWTMPAALLHGAAQQNHQGDKLSMTSPDLKKQLRNAQDSDRRVAKSASSESERNVKLEVNFLSTNLVFVVKTIRKEIVLNFWINLIISCILYLSILITYFLSSLAHRKLKKMIGSVRSIRQEQKELWETV
jgi:hypothetical protein